MEDETRNVSARTLNRFSRDNDILMMSRERPELGKKWKEKEKEKEIYIYIYYTYKTIL